MKFKMFFIGIALILVLLLLFNFGGDFITGFVVNEKPFSSSNFIEDDQIVVYDDRIVIKLDNSSISSYEDSGSMLPLINKDANGIKIKPTSPEEINQGDIITFEQNGKMIVHRVVKKGYDDEGEYFVTKGDNNGLGDGKVRFSQIRWVTVGILY